MFFAPRKKIKLVVSDFHLGKGTSLPDGTINLLEDFHADRQFVEFLDYFMNGDYRKAEVELILNGDFFNLLQIDYRNQFTDRITESDALHKTMSILKGHKALFDKLAEFSQAPLHAVTFILGNHDPGLLWPGVQDALKLRLKGEVKILTEAYRFDGIHVEHGNQYIADNRYDTNCYFLTEDLPEPIINLPWGSFLVIHYLNEIKKERPYIDRVYPFSTYLRWALINDTMFALRAVLRVIYYYFWFLLSRAPMHRMSFRHKIAVLKETAVHPKLHRAAKKILFSHRDIHTVIFGHTHQATYRCFAPGKEYFNTGTWTEKISLDVGSMGRGLFLHFVLIDYTHRGRPLTQLKEWKGQARVIEDVYF